MQANTLQHLASWMAGHFSSRTQAARDFRYFDVHLQARPIKLQGSDGYWLYIEQAMATALDEPYRQRIYHLTALEDGTFQSRIAELADPDAFVGAWERPEIFQSLREEDLVWRDGCEVALRWDGSSYRGATCGQACASTWNGSAYATSEVVVSGESLTSWDRGFDGEGRFVWGAIAGGYVFDKLSEYPLS
jgi:CpeT protein